VLDTAPWPYVGLGCGYAALAIALLVFGALRQRRLERAVIEGEHVPLPFRLVAGFTVAGVVLAIVTVLLVGAQL
jgi:putative membrane protein